MVKILGGRPFNLMAPKPYICGICKRKGEHTEFFKKKDLKHHKVNFHSYHASYSGLQP